jgi:ribonuclease III
VGKLAKPRRSDLVKRAEAIVGSAFGRPSLLEQALVHRSYLNENPGFPLASNERLEFLGDAVIGMIVSEILYNRFPDAGEGLLTTMRAELVRAQALGRFARELGIGELLHLSRGEDEAGGRTRPRLLAQAFEALVGALYVDRGLEASRSFVLRLLAPEVDRIAAEPGASDPKSRLQVIAQAATGITPVYELVSTAGPEHRPHFDVLVRLGSDVIGTGEGENKQEAEQAAAVMALKRFAPTLH